MYCTNCGNKINENENFCPNCGVKIISRQIENNQNNNSNYQNNQKNENRNINNNKDNSKIPLIIIAIIAFPFLCLIIGYNYRVNQKVNTEKIPYANQTINPDTKITLDMISYVDLPTSFVIGKYYKENLDIVGKCSNYNTIISKGSIFYTNLVEDCDIEKKEGLKNDVSNLYLTIFEIIDYYKNNQSTKEEIDITYELKKLDDYYEKITNDNENIKNYNLNETIHLNFMNFFNQSTVIYNEIKSKKITNNIEEFNTNFQILDKYYVSFYSSYN